MGKKDNIKAHLNYFRSNNLSAFAIKLDSQAKKVILFLKDCEYFNENIYKKKIQPVNKM